MYKNKYFVTILGNNRKTLCDCLEDYVISDYVKSETNNCSYYVHQIYNTGILEKVITHDQVSLLLHGIVFPWGVSIDELDAHKEYHLSAMIDKYRNNLSHFALSIRNGSYCGVLQDEKTDEFYAFTSFLNSFPVYYTEIDECLVVSNDLTLVAIISQAELKMSLGLVGYYIQGTNLSKNTAFDNIKTIPKGAYLRYYKRKIEVDYYYIMPKEKKGKKFKNCVDEFAQIWESNVNALHSDKFKYGLGLTGGIDSRLILSAMNNKKNPLFFTGSHPDHPDYLIAKKITKSLGLENHKLEDYRGCDKLQGYAEYCSMSDNPLLINSYYTKQQMTFRKNNDLSYTLEGGINLYGGEHYYKNRRSLWDTIIRSTVLLKNKYHSNYINDEKLIWQLLRNNVLKDDLSFFNNEDRLAYLRDLNCFIKKAFKQLGDIEYVHNYLERLRHVYKSTNLLTWQHIASRRTNENIVPEMNVELTDFACKIPLKQRDTRKILLSYLKRYHPETAKFVLTGYIFPASFPWILYKSLSNYIKAFNALGYKIPLFQWYIKKNDYQDISKMPELYQFQKLVCEDSEFLMNSPFGKIYKKYPNDKLRLMRLFNIAVLSKRMELGEDKLKEYLLNKIKFIRVLKKIEGEK